MFRRRMVANRVSTPSHSPGGQPANAAATAWRRGLAALRTLRARWPLISSIRLNSSITAWATQRCHNARMTSAGGFRNAVRPFAVS
jgi:hypothetical protein